ncbi:hypothetical protein EDD76_102279 [Kineothrix alysoides]|uniref:ReqiPepy6 Gp37-like protein n=1 Tax=Kineothrix alysoides TaxID=1469948 RepID=A0A4R1R4Z5_9FIRM|nr:hypothetical protein [Kineothrix alysoides]TCL60581.1 hypothetical protein EDD76_102279 [Kineothrix alysoides]
MRPYNVEIFTQGFVMVGNTNVNEMAYKEDYLSSDENSITIIAIPGIQKQDYIRISRGKEEYAGVISEVTYGTASSKKLQQISFKPLMELLNTDVLFDTTLQGVGTFESFICDRIREMFINHEDSLQNIKGLTVTAVSGTVDWGLHITPSDKGGHYNIVNLLSSIIIPALTKYGILVRTELDVQNKQVNLKVGKIASGVIMIESDLPNIIKKSVTIKRVNADVNKLVLLDANDYVTKKIYYLHSDLGYDTKNEDRITPVICEMKSLTYEEGSSFDSVAIKAAYDKFANLAYSNLIELTMIKGDSLIKPEEMEFGQVVNIISDGVSYRSILTGRETGSETKLIFGTVRLDLTKILRRNENGR